MQPWIAFFEDCNQRTQAGVALVKPVTMGPCTVCGNQCDTRCPSCKTVYFCGTACQKSGWKAHKQVCGKHLSTPTTASEPAASAVSKQPEMPEKVRRALTVMRSLVADGHAPQSGVQGRFVELLSKGRFMQYVFGGVDAHLIDPNWPMSLADLLNDSKHTELLHAVATSALPKAESVLDGVKSRGAAAGQVMDSKTEQALWPQIYAEAFALAIPATILAFSQRRREIKPHTVSPDESIVATPYSVGARTQMLGQHTLSALTDNSTRIALQAGPWSCEDSWSFEYGREMSEWCEMSRADVLACLVDVTSEREEEDSARSHSHGHGHGAGCSHDHGHTAKRAPPLLSHSVLSSVDGVTGLPGRPARPVNSQFSCTLAVPEPAQGGLHDVLITADVHSHTRWIDACPETEESVPALHDLLQRLAIIPHELNRKVPTARLHRLLPGCSAARLIEISVSMTDRPCSACTDSAARAELLSSDVVRLTLQLDKATAADLSMCMIYAAGEKALDGRSVEKLPNEEPHASSSREGRGEGWLRIYPVATASSSSSGRSAGHMVSIPSTAGNTLCLWRPGNEATTIDVVLEFPLSEVRRLSSASSPSCASADSHHGHAHGAHGHEGTGCCEPHKHGLYFSFAFVACHFRAESAGW